ncbi:hypothetical protein DP939_05520 [Spongiactinospora rosea]|uniref:SnoaL-like domain-containing protein n=1 Tax=Spongiactinospora rosea TaxID=2248750 RepID=A0A366M7E5_9ACTN|nr:nuclear transport factor 2 family protein [Spongiactinospora rosea]RBQ22116.1 hypothetical protein DP939_05520 [Spongiactinospora rosea]
MTQTSESNAARNKEVAVHVFKEFAAGDIEVLRDHLREDYIEHSPDAPSGRDAFIAYIATTPLARSKLDLKRVIAEGDHVVVHLHMVAPESERGVAIVDIFRMADGLIAEHWDVIQPVPEPDRVPHGMF